MKKYIAYMLLACLSMALFSCERGIVTTSELKTGNMIGRSLLRFEWDDFIYVDEVEASIKFTKYPFGGVKYVDSVYSNLGETNYLIYNSGNFNSLNTNYKRRALYKALDGRTDYDFIIITREYNKKNTMFLGSNNEFALTAKLYKFKENAQ